VPAVPDAAFELPDTGSLPTFDLEPPLSLPDDLATNLLDDPGFAEDIASDITPQAPDNLDFGG